MRKTTWFAVVGLALVAAMAPGCESTTGGGTGGAGLVAVPPGVVEIYRNNDATQIVGYCSPVDGTMYSWWLLDRGVEPPVMPRSGETYVTWKKVSDTNMDGKQLCDNYGPPLHDRQLWYVNRGDPADCVKVVK